MTEKRKHTNRKAKFIYDYDVSTIRLTKKTKTKFLKLLALEQLRSASHKILSADDLLKLLVKDYESLHRVKIQ